MSNKNLDVVKAELAEALHRKAVIEAADNFYVFVKLLAPLMLDGNEYRDGRHIQLLTELLQECAEKNIQRLMLSLPPGSMKSVLLMMFSAWCLGRNPTWRVMWISHTSDKAEDCSSRVRDLIRSAEYKEVFPHVSIREDKSGVTHWKLVQGGSFLPAGAGKSIAGYRFNLGIIDDPLSEQTAYSDIEREKINTWYGRGFRSRKLPDSIIIICATRWHVRDLNGYLLDLADRNPAADQWEYISIPAILDEKSAKLLGLKPGDTYWPEYISLEDLKKTRASLDKNTWNSLYLQMPVADSGIIFQEHHFKLWEEKDPPFCDEIIFSLDTAFSTKEKSDYSVIQVWGIFYTQRDTEFGETVYEPNAILVDARVDRWGYPELRQNVLEMVKKHRPNRLIIENKASGQSLIQDLRAQGLPIVPFQPDRDKVSRANAVTGIMELGRVWIPAGKTFSLSLLRQCLQFPKGAHDDEVDAMVMALLYLRRLYDLSKCVTDETEEFAYYKRPSFSYWESLNGRNY